MQKQLLCFHSGQLFRGLSIRVFRKYSFPAQKELHTKKCNSEVIFWNSASTSRTCVRVESGTFSTIQFSRSAKFEKPRINGISFRPSLSVIPQCFKFTLWSENFTNRFFKSLYLLSIFRLLDRPHEHKLLDQWWWPCQETWFENHRVKVRSRPQSSTSIQLNWCALQALALRLSLRFSS